MAFVLSIQVMAFKRFSLRLIFGSLAKSELNAILLHRLEIILFFTIMMVVVVLGPQYSTISWSLQTGFPPRLLYKKSKNILISCQKLSTMI